MAIRRKNYEANKKKIKPKESFVFCELCEIVLLNTFCFLYVPHRSFLECCSIRHMYQQKRLSLMIKRPKHHKHPIRLQRNSVQICWDIYFITMIIMIIMSTITYSYSMFMIPATGKRKQFGNQLGKKYGKNLKKICSFLFLPLNC